MKNPSYWNKTLLGWQRRKNGSCVEKGKPKQNINRKRRIENEKQKLIIKRNFKPFLANDVLFPKEDLPQSVKENMKHGKAYNEIARERYHNIM